MTAYSIIKRRFHHDEQQKGKPFMSTEKDIEIPDQTGTRAVVTGANSGIGFGITRRLAAAGAEVILAVRNLEKGNQAVKELLIENPKAKLSIEQIDLASLQSVKD